MEDATIIRITHATLSLMVEEVRIGARTISVSVEQFERLHDTIHARNLKYCTQNNFFQHFVSIFQVNIAKLI